MFDYDEEQVARIRAESKRLIDHVMKPSVGRCSRCGHAVTTDDDTGELWCFHCRDWADGIVFSEGDFMRHHPQTTTVEEHTHPVGSFRENDTYWKS